MAKLDSAKEEIGWLKVLFAVLAAVDASLIAWAAQNHDKAESALALAAMMLAGGITILAVWINRLVYRRIRELETL